MTSLEYRLDLAPAPDPPRVGLEPVSDHHLLLDGCWWTSAGDLGAQLLDLLPVLDQVRGPVARLLLSAAGWTTRPHQVVLADRTVSLGYLAEQPPSMMTVRCVDGGTFIVRVAPSGPAPGSPQDQGTPDASGSSPSRPRTRF